MKWVEFYFNGDEPRGRVVLEDGKLRYEDMPPALEEELRSGFNNQRKSTPDGRDYIQKPEEDPEWFLNMIPIEFPGGMFHATPVKTDGK